MFTGLIQTVGRISCMIRQGAECRLEIEADFGPNHVFQLGESIVVNGACLSVEKFAEDCFTVYGFLPTSYQKVYVKNIPRYCFL